MEPPGTPASYPSEGPVAKTDHAKEGLEERSDILMIWWPGIGPPRGLFTQHNGGVITNTVLKGIWALKKKMHALSEEIVCLLLVSHENIQDCFRNLALNFSGFG